MTKAEIVASFASYVECPFCGAENDREGRLEKGDKVECWNCDGTIVITKTELVIPREAGEG